nr:LOW QUALITY PROTEIN: zinc finger protein 80 [Saimiri boliviensis boliviensis]
MREGRLNLVTVSPTETFWRKMSPKGNGLGTGDGPHSCVLQDQVSTGDRLHECDSRGPSKDTLVGEGKTYKCKECGKVFNKISLLVRRQQIDTGVKPYECQECGKAFREKADFIRHMRIHTGEKPYKCTGCGTIFNSRSHLLCHHRIHTGEKPYAVTRSHTGEKPYECLECRKAFGYHSAFVRHSKIHSGGKKPLSANDVGMPFCGFFPFSFDR